MVKSNAKMWESLLKFAIGIVLILLLNVIASKYLFRYDLTEEKRYSITNATENMLGKLDDVVYVDVYLAGDLPAGMKRLKAAIGERLDEFKIYSNNNIQYKFIDPSQATSEKARNEFYRNLAQKGLQARRLFDNVDGKRTEKIIFPGAIITYGEREKVVSFLKGAGGQAAINQSIEGVEYELASGIRSLTNDERKKIGLLKGHEESDSLVLAGLTNVLLEEYNVYNVNLSEKETLEGYDAIIVSKPKKAFSSQDKYKIDQYIMRGGNVLFFLDQLYVDIDSALNQGTFALPIDVNLDDMLFKYGVRINRDLVQDLSSGVVPVIVNMIGDQPDIKNFEWPFFPIINQFSNHPIVKNSDAIYTKFISTIDSVKADGITKTPLLFSSKYSRKLGAPLMVSLNDIRNINKDNFKNNTPFVVAYILEGEFTSLYKNRILPKGISKSSFVPKGKAAKVLVVADGDLIENEFSMKNGRPVEMGYSEFMRKKFANEAFIKNALQYMTDNEGIITARSKEIKMRSLDKIKVQEERFFWQVLNIGLPLLLLLLFGVLKFFIRKRKYSNFTNETDHV